MIRSALKTEGSAGKLPRKNDALCLVLSIHSKKSPRLSSQLGRWRQEDPRLVRQSARFGGKHCPIPKLRWKLTDGETHVSLWPPQTHTCAQRCTHIYEYLHTISPHIWWENLTSAPVRRQDMGVLSLPQSPALCTLMSCEL